MVVHLRDTDIMITVVYVEFEDCIWENAPDDGNQMKRCCNCLHLPHEIHRCVIAGGTTNRHMQMPKLQC